MFCRKYPVIRPIAHCMVIIFAPMNKRQRNIRHLSYAELQEYFEQNGEKNFRAQQVWEWLWKKHASTIDEMTNLGKALRDQLQASFTLPALVIDTLQHSADGTIKTRFRTHDGFLVEGVLIPAEDRYTACVSSQIGCSLSCSFCATGFMDRKRNLRFDEIFDEAAILNSLCEKTFGRKITNIVFMGMGEPLLNYKNLLLAVERVSAADGLAMSPRRITVSTAGVAKAIRQLGDDQVKFKLALSLHAANDKKRNEMMPINKTNNIETLMEALNYFYRKTHNAITFEYILLKDFNDSLADAADLMKLYRQVPADLVNIIEYNPVLQSQFDKTGPSKTQAFIQFLEQNQVNVRLRRSRGKDIDAACGQLANKG